jgi:C-terminal processing protease CtpA/Prc
VKLRLQWPAGIVPNGQNIDKKGISPDKEIKMTEEDFSQKRDPQKDAALEFPAQVAAAYAFSCL